MCTELPPSGVEALAEYFEKSDRQAAQNRNNQIFLSQMLPTTASQMRSDLSNAAQAQTRRIAAEQRPELESCRNCNAPKMLQARCEYCGG